MYNLGLFPGLLNIKGNRALNIVQVIVQARGGDVYKRQGYGDAQQVLVLVHRFDDGGEKE